MVKDWLTVVKQIIFSIFYTSLIITILAGCGGSGSQAGGTGSVSLAWNVPTTYVDGTPATGMVGFKVYYGTASRTYTHTIDVKNVSSYTINALPHATYYLTVMAYDSYGNTSDYSNEIIKTPL